MARASKCQVVAYLLGHALLIVGFTFFTIGFATDHWMSVGDTDYGLWRFCGPYVCNTIFTSSSWLLATRAMQTMALVCYMLAFLLALFFNCLEQTAGHLGYTGKERILEIFITAGTAFCLIGVSVYGAKVDDYGTLDYSYGLTVLSLLLTAPGLIMVAVTRSDIRSNKTVGPHPDGSSNTTSTLVVSSTQRSGLAPSSGGSAGAQPQGVPRFSYGHGPNWAGTAGDSNTNMDGGAPDYANGGTRGGRRGELAPLPLPYARYPDRPAESGRVGPGFAHNNYPMPQPDPGPGWAGGDCGPSTNHFPMPQPEGGYGQGQGRGQGHLPPIPAPFAAPPTAPPDEGEAPPSYMEAIRGGRR